MVGDEKVVERVILLVVKEVLEIVVEVVFKLW